MASDKFEVGDILVCVDDSPYAKISGLPCLVKDKVYEVSEANVAGDVSLVGTDTSVWMFSRFRRATLAEIRKYRKEQGYEKHQFAIGDLVVCIADDYELHLSIGQTCVVSATKSDDERECFVDIDGGKLPGRFFAARFRKATPAEAAAYRKANEPPKAAPAPKNYSSVDSIDSVSRGDTIVFAGPNGNGRKYGAVAVVWTVIFGQGGKVSSLEIRYPANTNIEQWSHTSPDGWVPVGKGYELVALGQPIETGDEWLESVANNATRPGWYPTSFRTELKVTKITDGILRRKVKDAVTVQIGDKPPFKAVGVNFDVSGFDPNATPGPTFSVSVEWKGPEKMPLTGNDSPEAINKAISVPNPQTLTSADGREFDIIDWNPKVKTGEIVTVEANLLVMQAKEKSKSLADGLVGAATPKKPQWEPKAGDIVVCIDLLNTSPFRKDLLVQGKTYRIELVGSLGVLKIEGVPEYWYTSRFRLATPAEAQAFLDAEKQPPKDPGIGYRFLDKEEIVVEGDEFWSPTYRRWAASGNWQFGHDGKQVFNMTYRRRNQFAFGELVQIIKPATQALWDENPVWVGPMGRLGGKVLEMPKELGPSYSSNACIGVDGWAVSVNWLAPASSKQKEAFLAEKAAKEAKKAKKAKADDLRKQIAALQHAIKDLEASSF